MISRRIIRTKVLQILYAHFTTTGKTINQSESELNFSIRKTYDLYHLLFALLIEIRDLAKERQTAGKHKNIPSWDDLHPNTRFVDNHIINRLKENEALNSYIEQNKISWKENPELIRKLYRELVESKFYQQYLLAESNSIQSDQKLCERFFIEMVLNNDLFESELEEQSIYWNDDLDFVVSMVIKTIKKVKQDPSPNLRLLSLYKDDEDRDYTIKLFRKTILKHEENHKIIELYTKNWDVERVALMDVLILEMAITELTDFPSIPIKVTLNEYIELSKYYSTKRSSTFINGVLDRISKDFQEDGRVVKAGRGLLDGK
ncbi:transcription antitermination factor NusB [Prolixibacter sp. SD074]|uniref:transcription antitermination factor NusB n=1 Tax=Prolixibacter sp. SD074 TaxID=2652391 RepID=UPI001271C696|nr:transcription antitermination factor NusB [Prolixibacter sp. SD074]GET28434.1 N utilization substance protein B [Prolixibacter sp. SD074]